MGMDSNFLNIINILYRGKNHIIQQIQSFNNFLSLEIQNIINKNREIIIKAQTKYKKYQNYNDLESMEFSVKVRRIFYSKPNFKDFDGKIKRMTPSISRFKDLNYFCDIFLDLKKDVLNYPSFLIAKKEMI